MHGVPKRFLGRACALFLAHTWFPLHPSVRFYLLFFILFLAVNYALVISEHERGDEMRVAVFSLK